MGKIFGISNNPVSTIESSLRPLRLEPPAQQARIIRPKENIFKSEVLANRSNEANYFVKMRNGFGKLMSHFSHPNKMVKK